MSEPLTDAQKQVFKDASERRRAAGIRLGRFTIGMEASAVASANDMWAHWVEHLGKERATDYLLVCMRKGTEALERARKERT